MEEHIDEKTDRKKRDVGKTYATEAKNTSVPRTLPHNQNEKAKSIQGDELSSP